MTDSRDGCPAYDEELVEAALGTPLPAATSLHLASCGRCVRALDSYRMAGACLRAASAVRQAPPRLLTGRRAAAAAAVIVAAAFMWRAATTGEGDAAGDERAVAISEPPADVPGAEPPGLRAVGPATAAPAVGLPQCIRLDRGRSTFVVRDGLPRVETPLGALTCDNCTFTVNIACTEALEPSLVPCLLTLDVESGLVHSQFAGQSTILAAGPSGRQFILPFESW